MRTLFLTIGFLSLVISGACQIRFELTTDAKQVLAGDYVTITYTLFNARGSRITTPDFKGFKQTSPPSQSFSSSTINGRTSFQSAYSYTLLAEEPGSFIIPSTTITAGGKKYTSNSITIEVLKRAPRTDKEEVEPVYVNLELSTDTAYLGQQVLLDYKLYTTVDVRNFDIRYEPEYENTFAINIPTYNHFPQQREIINGASYVTKVMKRVALFPMQFGVVVLEPATINLGIEYEDPNSRSFFFRSKLKMERIQTNEASLTILPLPPNAPAEFNGAVGNYSMNAFLKERRAKTNEAITLVMTISGTGDEKRLIDPVLNFGENFDVYDPQVLNSNNDVSGPIIKTSKQLEYLIVSKKPGDFVINPSFTYFNPDSARYMTIEKRLPIRILPGAGVSEVDPFTIRPDGKSEMMFIQTKTKLKSQSRNFFGSILHYILLAIPFLSLVAGVLYKRHLVKEGNLDSTTVRYRRARKVAFQRLALAEELKHKSDARNFYDEISKATLGYVADKYDIPFSELSKETIRNMLGKHDIAVEIQNRFVEVLNTCEMALFAGQTSDKNLEDVYQEAADLIVQLEGV